MKLRRLEINLLPGIDDGFALEQEQFGDGMHVVLGPNGIGKSSLGRAMRSLLWRDGAGSAQVVSSARFESTDGDYSVTRETSSLRWQLDGLPSDGPPLPAYNLAPCFFLGLRDLLDIAGKAGGHVADAIREEMSGGYNLETIASHFPESTVLRRAKKQNNALGQAQNDVQIARREQEQLELAEATLKQLQVTIDGAAMASQRVARIAATLELQEDREQLAECEGRLALLPKSLGEVTGAEPAELDRIATETERKSGELRLATRDQKDAADKATATGLDGPLEDTLLTGAKARAAKLQEIEGRLARAEADWKGTQAAAAELSLRLGGAEEPPAALDLPDAAALFVFLREVEQNVASLDLVEQRIAGLETGDEGSGHLTAVQLQRGIDQLRLWLRSPEAMLPMEATELPGLTPAAKGICLTLILIGFALGFFVHPALFAIAGVGLGMLMPRGSGASDGKPSVESVQDSRAKAVSDYDLDPPVAWTEGEVASHLKRFEDQLVERKILDRQEITTKDRSRDLRVKRAALLKDEAELELRRTQLAGDLRLERVPATAELVDTARTMDQLREARSAERAAAGKLDAIGAEHSALLAQLTEDLVLAMGTAPTDAASALATVESLAKRDGDLRGAREAAKQAAARMESLDEELAGLAARTQAVLQDAGVGNRAELNGLLAQLEAFHREAATRGSLRISIERGEASLLAAGEQALLDMDAGQLQAERSNAVAAAESLESLSEQKAEIEGDIKRAGQGQVIEAGLSAKGKILDQLEVLRDEALFASAGNFLLETVTREHEIDSMPKVLEDARKLFAEFTQHRYDLRVHPERKQSFVAIETRTHKQRSLDELSDGTRIQLALAARLAFVKQAEQGNTLPLFLDEALDHSDDERFHAIASSLAKMVRDEGRQIFYLSSDASDIERLQRAFTERDAGQIQVINLAAARGRESAIRTADQLTIAPRAQVPEPGSLTSEQYGAKLEVPVLNPRKGAADTHLFYLLGDDLGALHSLLSLPIESAGQWSNLRAGAAPAALALETQSTAGAELTSRIALLDAFCGHRLIGRGKPVDTAALEASNTLTSTSLNKVPQIAKDLDGDARGLVQVLRSRGPHALAKGFPTKQVDALETYLVDEGYLAELSPLTEADLTAKVLTIPATAKLSPKTTRDLLHRWWTLTAAKSQAPSA
jgi:DNA repair protein SbcC/Rad50